MSTSWPSYLLLGAQALLPIIIGSWKSLKTPPQTLARRQARPRTAEEPDDDEEEDPLEDSLTWTETLVFPLVGSVALVGLYMVLKYVGAEWLNFLLGIYFSVASMWAVQSTLGSVVGFGCNIVGYTPETYHFRVSSGVRLAHATSTLPSLLLLPISVALPALYLPLDRPYLLSNLMALCLATSLLGILRLDSFLTGLILLGSLLVYDVFWVFATPVMLTVAQGLDAPLKLLVPRDPTSSTSTEFAMLGLGDIIVPGLMVALCLRFDLYRRADAHSGAGEITAHSKFASVYWTVGMGCYVLGLAAAMGAAATWQTAQPALLYLSPACVLGPVLTALVRGEIQLLWGYSDAVKPITKEKDGTIEPPSEAAMAARSEANERLVNGSPNGESPVDEVEVHKEDESWMDGPADTPQSEKKRRKAKRK